MSFTILINNPIARAISNNQEVYFIDGFLKKTFPRPTEFPIIIFNGILIDIDFYETLSANIYRIIDLLSIIQSGKENNALIHWAGGAFNSMWTLHWSENNISIGTEWGEIYPQSLSQVLETNPSCEMNKDEFLYEWKVLLNFIIRSIEESEVKIEDDYFLTMKDIESEIPFYGKYYQHLNKQE